MGQGARCRSDSGPPLSCIRWNRPEYRCHRAILSPNAANPTTCAKDLSGPAAGCWTAAATLAAFFEGWRQAPGNGPHGAAVQKHRPGVHFRFQKSSIWSLHHQTIGIVDYEQRFPKQAKHGFDLGDTFLMGCLDH